MAKGSRACVAALMMTCAAVPGAIWRVRGEVTGVSSRIKG